MQSPGGWEQDISASFSRRTIRSFESFHPHSRQWCCHHCCWTFWQPGCDGVVDRLWNWKSLPTHPSSWNHPNTWSWEVAVMSTVPFVHGMWYDIIDPWYREEDSPGSMAGIPWLYENTTHSFRLSYALDTRLHPHGTPWTLDCCHVQQEQWLLKGEWCETSTPPMVLGRSTISPPPPHRKRCFNMQSELCTRQVTSGDNQGSDTKMSRMLQRGVGRKTWTRNSGCHSGLF